MSSPPAPASPLQLLRSLRLLTLPASAGRPILLSTLLLLGAAVAGSQLLQERLGATWWRRCSPTSG